MKTAKSIAYIAVAAVIITVCSWLTVPFAVPFTMQTFAVFAVLMILGGKTGTAAIGLYVALGLLGVPVFSGFSGGFSHVIGPTGGYIVGFLLTGLLYTLLEKAISGKRTVYTVLTLTGGLILCYIAGTVWFVAVYGSR
ncbi:MAG: biotin transporter BioY, partial [Clostridia bacterium]|nr:biotin transporter BioY [Clostridia bacterium]